MIRNYKNTYENISVTLDNNYFEECEFRNCIIIYKGESGLNLVRCKIFNCQWKFEGPASNTIHFLRSMYKEMGDFGKQMVEATFENIKK